MEHDHDHHHHDQRCDDLLYELIDPYYQQQLPVIIRKAVAHHPAVSLWHDVSYWQQQLLLLQQQQQQEQNPTLVDIEMGPYHRRILEDNNDVTMKDVPLAQYISYLELHHQEQQQRRRDAALQHDDNNNHSASTPLLYAAQNELPTWLYQDIRIPIFLQQQPQQQKQKQHSLYHIMMWMGPIGCWTPYHYDPLDNLIMQFVGTKRFALIDRHVPNEYIYAGSSNTRHAPQPQQQQQYNTTTIMEEIFINNDDDHDHAININPMILSQYPLLHHLIPYLYIGTIYAGDILYIPARWWHDVKSIPSSSSSTTTTTTSNHDMFNISINMWWR